MIIISGYYRGAELKGARISDAIGTAIKAMERARRPKYQGTLGEVPHVNAVFVVEGSLGKPEFNDIQVGPYSRKDKCLQVEIAVLQSVIDEGRLRDAIVLGLGGANAVAFHFFDEKGMEFPLRDAEALVTRVGEELAEFA